MGSMSVSSCRCCMCVSCVNPVAVLNAPVAVLNAEFCMTCSLLLLVEDARGRPYGRGLGGSHECLLLFTPSC